jgi:hypothetical protein
MLPAGFPRNISVALSVFALAISLLGAGRAYAQVSGATVSGTVTDPSGATIPDAQITITDVGKQASRTVTTDSDGFYTAPNFVPGIYDVRATAPGFSTKVLSGIQLTVGAKQVLNIRMAVGQIAETVQVTVEVPQVDLMSSTLGNVVNSTTVVELPLNGRDWAQLATLESGVNTLQTQITGGFTAPRGNRGFGTQLTISGTRPQMNNYRLDGISLVDYAGGAPGSVLGITLGVDAIGEFSVLTSNYSAEYGRTSGGVLNAVTRSGKNQFHGDAYWFIRDEGFDARGYFDTASVPPFHRNQFGASAGGPIFKDKTFFFANYEGYRQTLANTNSDKVPSQDARNGIIAGGGAPLADCSSYNTATTTASQYTLRVPGQSNICVSNAVIPYLDIWPVSTGAPIGSGNTVHYDVVTSQNANENFVTTRIDQKFSEKDSLFGTWFLDKARMSQPDVLNTVRLGNISTRLMVAAEETHAFSPSLVNSLRIGYSRIHPTQNLPIAGLRPLATDNNLGTLGAGTVAPQMNVSGVITTFGGGLGQASFNNQRWNSIQLYDDAFLNKGTHSLKFGFAFENMRHTPTNATGPNGAWVFGGLLQLLQNQPKSVKSPGQPTAAALRQSLFGGYLQDDWRVRPSLTLNLGLRYEMVTDVSEARNQFISNLRQFTTDVTPALGAPFIQNPTLRNFEPRIGFAWDPFHDGKTSIRGAFGIFDILPLISQFFTTTTSTFPYVKQFNVGKLKQGDFPTIISTLVNSGTANSVVYSTYQFNPHRDYVMIWNLNIQRQLTASTTLTVGYVGNHGVHMFDRSDDANTVLPTSSVSGQPLWPIPGSGTQEANPNINGPIQLSYWGGDALYDALQATLSKRFSHGFQAQGSFTWGKNIDTGSATSIPDPYQNSLAGNFWFCTACRRGLSDFNIAKTLTINYIWDIPTPNNWGGIASHVLGGWEVGGILTAHTGVPVTPLMGGDPLGQLNTVSQDVPNRLTGCSPTNPGNVTNYINVSCFGPPAAPASMSAQCAPFTDAATSAPSGQVYCSNLYGNAGRNSIVGPGLLGLDFSLFKNNYIKKFSETFNIQFRAEFFNIINHANFETPINSNTLFDENGVPQDGAGSLDTLATRPREIQFGLKLIW